METKLLYFNEKDLSVAGEIVRSGGLVAFPTETVYGLGADALNEDAVRKIFAAKGRPADNPLIVHVADKSRIVSFAHMTADGEKIAARLMPGSITMVLPKKPVVPDIVTAGLPTVAVRLPSSAEARAFLKACDVPVAAPSANTSSRPSPTNWRAVLEDLNGKTDAVLCGKDCDVGIESTVLDLSGSVPRVLRPGIVTPSEIAGVLGKDVKVVTDPKEKVNSPGVRYKHYAPACEMVLNVDGDRKKLLSYYEKYKEEGKKPVLLVQDPQDFAGYDTYPLGRTEKEAAKNLFAALRACEKRFDVIIACFCPQGEVSDSVLNRMTKSAGNKIL